MKRKLLAIIAVVAVIFVTAVLWRVDAFVFDDRLNWAEAQGRNQMVSIGHSVQVEIKALERIIYSFTSENFRKDRINWNSLQPYYAVASLNLNSQGEPQTQSLFVKEKSVAFNWNADFLNKAIGRIGNLKAAPGSGIQFFVKPFQGGNNKERHVALIFVNGPKAYALVGAGEIFQSLIDAQKGSLNSFTIVTTAGLTVGHNVPEYVATLLTEDTMYKIATQSGVSQGSGVFDAPNGQKIFGLYSQVPNSNLLILSSAPFGDIMKGRTSLLWQFFLLGVGLVMVGIAGILLAIRPHEKSLERLRLHASALLSGKKDFRQDPANDPRNLTPDIAEIDEILSSLEVGAGAGGAASGAQVHSRSLPVAPLASVPAVAAAIGTENLAADRLEEKMQVYRRVASAIGHELRAPLSAILGSSQMVLAKNPDAETTANVHSILRESRSARGIIEKLFSFAGEQELTKSEMKLETVLARSLEKMSANFAVKGVQLVKEIELTSTLPISVEELGQAFENIFTNAVEAMERMPQKKLIVRLFEDAAGIHLEVRDTGEGIEAKNLEQIFDPFFTTRSFQNHVGLGLAVSMGILKEHGADVQMVSKRGDGAEIKIIFAKQKSRPILAAPVAPSKAAVPDSVDTVPTRSASAENVSHQVLRAPASALIEAQAQAMSELAEVQKRDGSVEPQSTSNQGDEMQKNSFTEALDLTNFSEIQKSKSIDTDHIQSGISQDSLPAAEPPADVNIDSLLELPPATAPSVRPPAAPPSQIPPMILAAGSVDLQVPQAKVAAPRLPPPSPKKSRLDEYQVEIRKPGKR